MQIINSSDNNIKLVIVGNTGVGKSAIVKRWLNNEFHTENKKTMAADIYYKSFNQSSTTLQIWDIEANERYFNMMPVYLHDLKIVIIVVQADQPTHQKIEQIRDWLIDVNDYITEQTRIAIIESKSDLADAKTLSDVVLGSLIKPTNGQYSFHQTFTALTDGHHCKTLDDNIYSLVSAISEQQGESHNSASHKRVIKTL